MVLLFFNFIEYRVSVYKISNGSLYHILQKNIDSSNLIVHHKVRESSLTKSRNCVLAFETLYKCTLKELQMIKSDILANENHFLQQNNSAFIVLVIAAIALKD